MNRKRYEKILISRTDNIGDVVLTMPLAGILKKKFPDAEVFFLGKDYTRDILSTSIHIDRYLNWSELENRSEQELGEFLATLKIDLVIHVFPNRKLARAAKVAGVPWRLGTRNRWFHWTTCNLLSKLSRRKSDLHEAQLNIKLCDRILERTDYSLSEIYGFYGTSLIPEPDETVSSFLSQDRRNVVLHPRSLGSAREWGIENYSRLIELLNDKKYNIIVTGTQAEGDSMRHDLLEIHKNKIIDTTGKLSLQELISLIAHSTGLVAASTGPLHIAACTGVNALGLYVMTRPMHPGRWRPVGPKASFLVYDENDFSSESIRKISPETVLERIMRWE